MTWVFVAALATALATGLGALPFLVVHTPGPTLLAVANIVASVVMIAAAVQLLLEGWSRSALSVVGGALAGALFVGVARRALAGHVDFGALHGADARKALLIVGVMTFHSAAEGVGVGSAFGDGKALGLLITVAIAVHNIPEGLAISLVLVPRGARVRTAAAWSVFSSLPQPLLAVPAYLFVESFKSVLPIGLGFAAGAMAWLVARELLPETFVLIASRARARRSRRRDALSPRVRRGDPEAQRRSRPG